VPVTVQQRTEFECCVFVAGITLNWGVMIAWSAIHGSLTTPGFVLYTSCVLWTMIYDTIYSHQVCSQALHFLLALHQWFHLLRQMYTCVVRLSLCLSYFCTLLKPLDGMRCHLEGTLVWHSIRKGARFPTRRGDLGVRTPNCRNQSDSANSKSLYWHSLDVSICVKAMLPIAYFGPCFPFWHKCPFMCH